MMYSFYIRQESNPLVGENTLLCISFSSTLQLNKAYFNLLDCYSPPPSADAKNAWRYTSTPTTSFYGVVLN